MKTEAELADLKRQWEADPHWGLAGTEGFEDHREELEAHEKAYWDKLNRKLKTEQQKHRERAEGVNHLEAAKIAALNANLISRPTDPEEELRYATMHAAVAQAEAMTRIAEVLETMLEAEGQAPDIARRIVRCEGLVNGLQSSVGTLLDEVQRLGETVENGDGESWGDDLRAEKKQAQEWAEAERRRLGIA